MNTNSYLTDCEGPEISTAEILEFLVTRFHEIIETDEPRVPAIFHGLALVAVSKDEELASTCKALFSSPHLPPKEILRRSIELFQGALESCQDDEPSQEPIHNTEEDHELSEKSCRHIMMVARREGTQMLEQGDYRFVKIFECLSWIGLQCDSEWLDVFEEARAHFKDDPENLIKVGIDVIRDCLFRLRPIGRVVPSRN